MAVFRGGQSLGQLAPRSIADIDSTLSLTITPTVPPAADTALYAVDVFVFMQLFGIMPAVVLDPSAGVLLRLGLACFAGVPLDDVSINSTVTSNSIDYISPEAPVNLAAGNCSHGYTRRFLQSYPAARTLADATMSVAVGITVLVPLSVVNESTQLAFVPAIASLLTVIAPLLNSTNAPTFGAFLVAAATESGAALSTLSIRVSADTAVVGIGPVVPSPAAASSIRGLTQPEIAGLAFGLAVVAILLFAICVWAVQSPNRQHKAEEVVVAAPRSQIDEAASSTHERRASANSTPRMNETRPTVVEVLNFAARTRGPPLLLPQQGLSTVPPHLRGGRRTGRQSTGSGVHATATPRRSSAFDTDAAASAASMHNPYAVAMMQPHEWEGASGRSNDSRE